MKKNGRIILLGIDGLDPSTISVLAQRSLMPNYAKLRKDGAFALFSGELPPLSPPAWTSIFTGRLAKNHGIFDFGLPKCDEFGHRLTDSRDRRFNAIWETVSHQGKRAIMINEPISWPPHRINGIMITGMHSPDLESAIWPPDFFREFKRDNPDYILDVQGDHFGDKRVLLEEICAMIQNRQRAFEYLLSREEPDLAICVFVGIDRLLHHCFHNFGSGKGADSGEFGAGSLPELLNIEGRRSLELVKSETGSLPDFSEPYTSDQLFDRFAMERVYGEIDQVFGRILGLVGPEDHVIIASDHGFGPKRGTLDINWRLSKAGLLKYHKRGPRKNQVDLERTRAYSLGANYGIWVNLKGRYPWGAVEKKDYGHIVEKVKKAFSSYPVMEILENSDPLLLKGGTYSRCQLSSDDYRLGMPDLKLILKNWDYGLAIQDNKKRQGNFLGDLALLGGENKRKNCKGGTHRPDGILLMMGKNIKSVHGKKTYRARHIDLYPTILRLMNLRLPADLDGKCLNYMLKKNVPPPLYCGPEGPRAIAEKGVLYDNSENIPQDAKEGMEKRLRALGYL